MSISAMNDEYDGVEPSHFNMEFEDAKHGSLKD